MKKKDGEFVSSTLTHDFRAQLCETLHHTCAHFKVGVNRTRHLHASCIVHKPQRISISAEDAEQSANSTISLPPPPLVSLVPPRAKAPNLTIVLRQIEVHTLFCCSAHLLESCQLLSTTWLSALAKIVHTAVMTHRSLVL